MRVFYRMDREVQQHLKTPEQAMQESLLQKYLDYTPSLEEPVQALKSGEPLNDRLMTNNRLRDLDAEIELAELEGLFNYTNVDLREIEIAAPWNDYNPLHYCSIMDKPRFGELHTSGFCPRPPFLFCFTSAAQICRLTPAAPFTVTPFCCSD